jgi:hypothetical protein
LKAIMLEPSLRCLPPSQAPTTGFTRKRARSIAVGPARAYADLGLREADFSFSGHCSGLKTCAVRSGIALPVAAGRRGT